MVSRSIIDAIRKAKRYFLFPLILNDWRRFRRTPGADRLSTGIADAYPCIHDKTATTSFDSHYINHTSWAARVVKEIDPAFHVDISSSLYFCGIVSAFIPVRFYDYRPAELSLSNLESRQGDLHNLPFEDGSIQSISCMHTLEHVGLGRFGDPIRAEGDLIAIRELKRVVATGGSLLIVVPVGRPRIEFNAHRIYSYEQILSYVLDAQFVLKEFAFIPEYNTEGPMVRHADPAQVATARYACGCFWFQRT